MIGIRNAVDKLGYNKVKEKRIEAKNDDVDDGVMKYIENDHRNSKEKRNKNKGEKRSCPKTEATLCNQALKLSSLSLASDDPQMDLSPRNDRQVTLGG
ncbi:32293_t:CDS:2 [Racocetra persica]|uniref:32293_t:CDS:1 n=1 Tax=Racocetra persica TaxID=160502 RepID=A0ACA9PBZ4_9GLOM|nr:32293_t:CDS:2 [Racocetra persica]